LNVDAVVMHILSPENNDIAIDKNLVTLDVVVSAVIV
jgi:hypothetical protein